MPPSTVARVYERLKEDGILLSIRGSKTLLQGLHSGRCLRVRGFVGIPVFIPRFVTLQGYRAFIIAMRRTLRARGFAVANVFYDVEQGQNGGLAEHMTKNDFDVVLWYEPERAARHTAPALRDRGVPVIGVSDRSVPSFPCRYEIHRDAAISAVLREWRSKVGIASVCVIRASQTAGSKEELVKSLIEEADLACQFSDPADQRFEDFLESIGHDKRHGYFFSSAMAALFAFRAPVAFGELMSRARVCLTGGPPSIAFAPVPDTTVDLVIVDWQQVANRIATDLLSGNAVARGEVSSFEAKAQFRARLPQYSQTL